MSPQSPIADLLADRRRQWAQLPAHQQMQRIQYALLDFQDYAVRRRQLERRHTVERLRAQRQRRQVKAYDPL